MKKINTIDDLKHTIRDSIYDIENFIQIILSGGRKETEASKINIRHILIKEDVVLQFSKQIKEKIIHENIKLDKAIDIIANLANNDFRQCIIKMKSGDITILVSKNNRITILSNKTKNASSEKSTNNQLDDINRGNFSGHDLSHLVHNKKKNYILEEGTPVNFLIDLGIMNDEGIVVKRRYDKFRQINRYLEFVRDIIKNLDTTREVTIVDFGCGKSYLTYALYYYLVELQKIDANIIGLDLKEDVIKRCNSLAQKYGYSKLNFYKGDIVDFDKLDSVDMVVTLHACDVATDYAIEKAIKWNADVIMVVPCCQHEVNKTISSSLLAPALKYGIIKERISALLTDSIRANILESLGYDTDIMEFVDIENTPKNLLIRASKSQKIRGRQTNIEKINTMTDALNINTTLQRIFSDYLPE